MTFRFVGTSCEFGDKRLSSLGEKVESDAAHGAALITEEEYAECGFTPDDEKRYATPGSRVNAPEQFVAKLRKAHAYAVTRQAEEVN